MSDNPKPPQMEKSLGTPPVAAQGFFLYQWELRGKKWMFLIAADIEIRNPEDRFGGHAPTIFSIVTCARFKKLTGMREVPNPVQM
jgi:hypothetical protein